jgi:geranyl-CoA carboxylase alpha subunit
MADRHGNIVHLGERDCSVQRRHQKLIEESPSPAIDSELRERMGESAIRAARAINYEGAGTVEFLLDGTGSYYFMEMNTRLQVEHPVTEAVTGLDLVELQLRVAAGEELPVQQQDVHITGHSIEVRLCCEDSQNGFMPQSGSLSLWRAPSGVRVEHALESGSTVPAQYDSMIAKLISVGKDRAEALRRLTLALDELVALGLKTNQVFLARCLHHPVFTAGDATTSFIESESEELLTRDQELGRKACAIAALLLQTSSAKPGSIQAGDAVLSHHFPISARLEFEDEVMEATLVRSESSASYTVTVDDQSMQLAVMTRGESDVMISCDGLCDKVVFTFSDGDLVLQVGGDSYRVRDQSLLPVLRKSADADGNVKASMTGRVVALHVAVGDEVTVGQPIVTLEAMKMEHTHNAPVAGRIEALAVKENQQVSVHQVIAQIKVEKEITDDVVVESQVVGAS